MEIKEAQKLLLDYLYGELEPEKVVELETLLKTDEALRNEYEEMKGVSSVYRENMNMPYPVNAASAALSQIKKESEPGGEAEPKIFHLRDYIFHPAVSVAAIFMVVATIMVMLPDKDEAHREMQKSVSTNMAKVSADKRDSFADESTSELEEAAQAVMPESAMDILDTTEIEHSEGETKKRALSRSDKGEGALPSDLPKAAKAKLKAQEPQAPIEMAAKEELKLNAPAKALPAPSTTAAQPRTDRMKEIDNGEVLNQQFAAQKMEKKSSITVGEIVEKAADEAIEEDKPEEITGVSAEQAKDEKADAITVRQQDVDGDHNAELSKRVGEERRERLSKTLPGEAQRTVNLLAISDAAAKTGLPSVEDLVQKRDYLAALKMIESMASDEQIGVGDRLKILKLKAECLKALGRTEELTKVMEQIDATQAASNTGPAAAVEAEADEHPAAK